MKVEIWADLVCPWCYIGKRRFESALAAFEHRDEVEVVWRSFELDPTTVSDTGLDPDARPDHAGHLAEKYGMSPDQAREAVARTVETAAAEGLVFAEERRTSNTLDAHRLVHLAAEHGLAEVVQERLMHAHFTEAASLADRDRLVALAAEVGLDADLAARALAGDDHVDAVRADEAEAAALGIRGVPFFVLDRAYGASGAQPADHLLAALEQAHRDGATRVPA